MFLLLNVFSSFEGFNLTMITAATTTKGHRQSRPANNIGVGRFRILGGGGGPRYRILGGGANSQQAHDIVMTSMRRNDVASTSF